MDRFVIAKVVRGQAVHTFYGAGGFGPLENAVIIVDRAEVERVIASLPQTGPDEQYQPYYVSDDGKHISPVM